MGLTKPRSHQLQNLDYKQAVRAVSITNVTLAGSAPTPVDGVSLALNDRILVTGQSTGSQNGIYRVSVLGNGSNGTWTRAIDADESGDLSAGIIVMVTEGSTYADTTWKLTTNNPITVGSTSLTFEVNTGAGSGTVTSVSVTTANGVSGTVATATTTPALTIALGAITPSAVQVSGLTASEILSTDASKNLTSLAVATYPSLAELAYAKGVTSAIQTQINAKGTGTVTSVGFTGGLISVATATSTPALTVAGTSGGIPYFTSTSTWATSALLTASALMLGGGAGATPTTTTTGSGVVTALGVNTGSAGAVVLFNGALGTPTSGTMTNVSGTAASLTAGNATNTAITDDTSTASTMYPTWVTTTTGNLPQKVSSTKLTFKPSTGELQASVPIALNGLFVNATTLVASYTVASGQSAQSVGGTSGFTIPGGLSVTLSSGSRWLVL